MSDRPDNRIPKPEDLDSLLETLASDPEDGEGPQPQQIAERRAARAGRSFDDVLAEDRARLRRSTYPRPECLQPYEVERYFLGTLQPERVAHRDTCAACSALLHAASPSETGAERIVEEVRETAEALGRAAVLTAEPVTVPQPRLAWWPRWLPEPRLSPAPAYAIVLRFGAALGFLTATLPVLVAVFVVFLLYRFAPPLAGASEVVRSLLTVTLQPVVAALVAAVVLAAAAAWLATRVPAGSRLFDKRVALAAGAVLTLVVGVLTWRDLGQRAREMQVGLTLVNARLVEVVATSLEVHRTTGGFPRVESSQPLALTTSVHTADRAVYRASIEGLPGTVVADVRPDGGAIYWQRAHGREQLDLGGLVVGTIDAVTQDGFVLRDSRGTSVTIKARPDPARRPEDRVIAVVDPRTNTAITVHPVARLTSIIPRASER